MSIPSEATKITVLSKTRVVRETNAIMDHHQPSNEEAQPSGSTTVREALGMRKASNKKKTLNKKKKKKVPKKIVYFDSDESS